MSIKQSIIEAIDVAKLQAVPFAMTIAVVIVIYVGSLVVPPGWATYALIVPPALVVAITALARVNDIGPEKMSTRWHVRRVGLIMAGAGAVMLLGAPFTSVGYEITWRGVVLIWGVGLAWLTTPEMPPWEEYITGFYRQRDGSAFDHFKHFAGRVTGQHRARDLQKRRRGEGDGP